MENKVLSCTSATALQHNVCEAAYKSVFQQDYAWSKLLKQELCSLNDWKQFCLSSLFQSFFVVKLKNPAPVGLSVSLIAGRCVQCHIPSALTAQVFCLRCTFLLGLAVSPENICLFWCLNNRSGLGHGKAKCCSVKESPSRQDSVFSKEGWTHWQGPDFPPSPSANPDFSVIIHPGRPGAWSSYPSL